MKRLSTTISLSEKCSNTESFLVRIFLYSVRIQEFSPNSVQQHAKQNIRDNKQMQAQKQIHASQL